MKLATFWWGSWLISENADDQHLLNEVYDSMTGTTEVYEEGAIRIMSGAKANAERYQLAPQIPEGQIVLEVWR